MISKRRRVLELLLVSVVLVGGLVAAGTASGQDNRLYRVGVVFHGGSYAAALDGLRDGLRDLGLEDGKHVVFHVRETRGDLSIVEATARALEAEKVDLVYIR